MRWLQYGHGIDFENGLGGVETHARCVARELGALGIDARLSNRASELRENWDVIHTHGGALAPKDFVVLAQRSAKAVWCHTLHGLTYERMWACGEYFWPGGYLGVAREFAAVAGADVVASIHGGLSLLKAPAFHKKTVICGNGWDSWGFETPTTIDVNRELAGQPPYWLFLGRGGDAVKNVAVIKDVWRNRDDILAVAPGEGFTDLRNVKPLGRLGPEQVRGALLNCRGLLLPSLYEGLPLVVLEALGEGVPVVTTNVGGLKTLPVELRGLVLMPTPTVEHLKNALNTAASLPLDQASRRERAAHNRSYLKSWRQVAQCLLLAVKRFSEKKP